jgi:hypothetical protein
LPVTATFPPGHWELFKMALDLAQAGALVALNDAEQEIIQKIARKSELIFPWWACWCPLPVCRSTE